ncbi:MAG TPA: hypothetical protein VH084_19450 [Mycobacterium sp.]|nr:hypothetical protein [Mycobacterium sp.]
MGDPSANDGSIERADFDGQNRKTIVPQGGTFTPKQIQLEKESGKLYWCDREGMRLMRANLDGSNIETLVDSSKGDPRPGPDPTNWCVGVAIDVDGGKVYWTQKVPTTPAKAAFSAPASKFPPDRRRLIASMSNFSMTGFPSRSIWSSIPTTASCIGPTGAIRRAATR